MSDPSTSEDFLRKAREGDRAAFDVLVQPLLGELRGFAAARLGANLRLQVESDDIVQEALLGAFERIATFEPHGDEPLKQWLFVEDRFRKLMELQRFADELRRAGREARKGS